MFNRIANNKNSDCYTEFLGLNLGIISRKLENQLAKQLGLTNVSRLTGQQDMWVASRRLSLHDAIAKLTQERIWIRRL